MKGKRKKTKFTKKIETTPQKETTSDVVKRGIINAFK